MKSPCPILAAAALCACLLAGCASEKVALSPPMHARVVDGVTGRPLDAVQVTLLSKDAPDSITGYSDRTGAVALPPLLAPDQPVLRAWTDTPHLAVRAVFQRPGYDTYTIDSVNGYGFFRGYSPVRLFPE